MKKLVMAAAVAVMALGAQAEITYKMLHGYNEGALDTTSYSLYARAAKDTTFLGKEMSITAIEDYFASAVAAGNWDSAKAAWQKTDTTPITTAAGHEFAIKAVVDQGTALTFDRKSSEEQFNYWAVVFYQNGDTEAYRVVQAENWKNALPVTITEDDKGTWGEWHTVPEPTSAMLMLLGVAGLALKRKRA